MSDDIDSGLSPDLLRQIQTLMGQMTPSKEDKRGALSQGLLHAGFGILANAANNPWVALGKGAGGGLLAYNDEIKQSQAQRNQNLQAASQIIPMIQKQQNMKAWADMANAPAQQPSGQGVAPVAGVSPRTASQFGQPSDTVGFDNQQGPAPMTIPQGTAPQSVAGFAGPNWRNEMPKEMFPILGMSDPKTQATNIAKFSESRTGHDGTVMTASGRPLYRQTAAGVQFFNPDGSPGRFMSYAADNVYADANRAGAIKGAEAAATKKAEFPYQIDTAIGANGAPMRGFSRNIYGDPLTGEGPALDQRRSAADQAREQAAQGRPVSIIERKGGGLSYGTTPSGSGVITGQSPLALKQGESNIALGQKTQELDLSTANKWYEGLQGKAEGVRQMLDMQEAFKAAAPRTGQFAEQRAFTANVLQGLGVDPAKFGITGAQDIQELKGLVGNILGAKAKQLPGALSDKEGSAIKSTWATISNTPQANNFLVDFATATARREYAEINFANQWREDHNGDMRGAQKAAMEQPWYKASLFDDPSMQQYKNVKAGPLVQNSTAIYNAKQAIRKGADRDAVKARLDAAGVDTRGL